MSNLSSEKIKIQKIKYQMSKKDKKKLKKKDEEKKKKKSLKKKVNKQEVKKDKKSKKKGKSKKKSKKKLKTEVLAVAPQEQLTEGNTVVKKVTPRKPAVKKVVRKTLVRKPVVKSVSEKSEVKPVGSMAMTAKEAIIKIRTYKTLTGLLNFVKTENRATVLRVFLSKKNQLSKK